MKMKPIQCRCPKCVSMCAHSACVPTPQEAQALIRAGYAKRMAIYQPFIGSSEQAVIGPAVVGAEGGTRQRTEGRCTFHTADGKCELHDLGLKPLEGRIAHHSRDWRVVRMQVNSKWSKPAFEQTAAVLSDARATVTENT
jgi:hypothetical protein